MANEKINDNWNSSLYDQKHSFVYEYGKELLTLLKPQAGERILDIGCGTGHLTAQIAASGAKVIGMDFSAAMIEKARAEYPALELIQADATNFSFDEPFDAVFSNATFHWIPNVEAATQCIANALKKGGRMIIEFGGKRNIANIMAALEASLRELKIPDVSREMYYASIGEYAPVLEKYGLEVEQAFLFDRPTKLDGEDGMLNWLCMFGTMKTENLSEAQRTEAFHLAESKLRAVQYHDGQWYADYRRIRVVVRKL